MTQYREQRVAAAVRGRPVTIRQTVLLLSVVPGMLTAQVAAAGSGQAACKPDLGWNAKDCVNCMINGNDEVQYLAEPVLRGVETAADSPAAGQLREQDVLVSVNDQLITTEAAWRILAQARSGATLRLTVRREGKQLPVAVHVVDRCASTVPTAAKAPQRLLLSEGRGGVGVEKRAFPSTLDTVRMKTQAAQARIAAQALDQAAANQALYRSLVEANMTALTTANAALGADSARRDMSARLRLGIGISCGTCSGVNAGHDSMTVYRFTAQPVVTYVAAGGPADRAGVRLGDTIAMVNNTAITTEYGGRVFSTAGPGEHVLLRLLHGPQTRTVTVTAEVTAAFRAATGTAVKFPSFRADSATPRPGGASPKLSANTLTEKSGTVSSSSAGEFFIGNVHLSIEGGFKVIVDPVTHEMVFTLSDGHVVRVKAEP